MSETLAESKRRTPLIIADISGEPKLKERLEEIGFIPGSKVEIVAKLPFSGPIACRIRGATYALRKADASSILVTNERSDGVEPFFDFVKSCLPKRVLRSTDAQNWVHLQLPPLQGPASRCPVELRKHLFPLQML